MNSGLFTCVLNHLHIQRSRCYYLKRKQKSIDKENLIKIVETLVND